MDDRGKDVLGSPERDEKLLRLVDAVEKQIYLANGIDSSGLQHARDFVWMESDDELRKTMRVKDPGFHLASRGQVISYTEKGEYQGSIVYLDPGIRQGLADSTDSSRLKGKDFADFQTLVEEVSHFVLIQNYVSQFRQQPHAALAELIAVLDRFNIFNGECLRVTGQIADTQTQQKLFEHNSGMYDSGLQGMTPGVYVVGHRLGVAYLGYLNQLHNEGGDASGELGYFYHSSNQEQFRHLLYDCGLDFQTHSQREHEDVEKLAAELGVKIFRG